MTYYMTKVWGFGVPAGPLQFASRGWREAARAKLHDGDRVILVGTQGEETPKEERGRLLGMMEPTRESVASLDFTLRQATSDYNASGEYRWPFALHNKRAWIFRDRPFLTDVSSRRFNMDAVLGIVPLTPDEVALVERLHCEPVELLKPREQALARIDRRSNSAIRNGPPPSTTTRAGIMHMRNARAYTYAMEIQGANRPALKIGWAFDTKRRRDGFNLVSLPALGGLQFVLRLTQPWETAREAFAMEQALLKRYTDRRSQSNFEVLEGIRLKDFEQAWVKYLRDNY